MTVDTEEIIDLTDLIEEGDSSARVSRESAEKDMLADQMKSLNDVPHEADDAIDALLHQMEAAAPAPAAQPAEELTSPSLSGPDAPSQGPDVNPNEQIVMPGIDDVDDLLNHLDIPGQPHAAADAPADDDTALDSAVEGLLSSVGVDVAAKPAPAAPAPAPAATIPDAKPVPAPPATPAAEADDPMESLLREMSGSAKPAAAPARPSMDDDMEAALNADLDSLMADLGDPVLPAAAQPAAAAPLTDLPSADTGASPAESDGLDALLDEPASLKDNTAGMPLASPAPAAPTSLDDMAALLDAAPASPSDGAAPLDDMFNEELAALEKKVAKSAPAAPAAAGADDMLADLDAALADLPDAAAAVTPPAAPAAPAAAGADDMLADLDDALADLPDAAAAATPPAAPAAPAAGADDMLADLDDALEETSNATEISAVADDEDIDAPQAADETMMDAPAVSGDSGALADLGTRLEVLEALFRTAQERLDSMESGLSGAPQADAAQSRLDELTARLESVEAAAQAAAAAAQADSETGERLNQQLEAQQAAQQAAQDAAQSRLDELTARLESVEAAAQAAAAAAQADSETGERLNRQLEAQQAAQQAAQDATQTRLDELAARLESAEAAAQAAADAAQADSETGERLNALETQAGSILARLEALESHLNDMAPDFNARIEKAAAAAAARILREEIAALLKE
ncbi:hypothetical protein [uncultured Desulfovibrio sp.]|uniref:hypothetical protein n=1 Tax=uncultured Desulfovibrio sp. TaxID=167968 RepID=UPI0026307F72|nr:hypothetical protein [uncultured Desulfovibrio sp.]